jgi:hypothetical protein
MSMPMPIPTARKLFQLSHIIYTHMCTGYMHTFINAFGSCSFGKSDLNLGAFKETERERLVRYWRSGRSRLVGFVSVIFSLEGHVPSLANLPAPAFGRFYFWLGAVRSICITSYPQSCTVRQILCNMQYVTNGQQAPSPYRYRLCSLDSPKNCSPRSILSHVLSRHPGGHTAPNCKAAQPACPAPAPCLVLCPALSKLRHHQKTTTLARLTAASSLPRDSLPSSSPGRPRLAFRRSLGAASASWLSWCQLDAQFPRLLRYAQPLCLSCTPSHTAVS